MSSWHLTYAAAARRSPRIMLKRFGLYSLILWLLVALAVVWHIQHLRNGDDDDDRQLRDQHASWFGRLVTGYNYNWHNATFIAYEAARTGTGEQGRPVLINDTKSSKQLESIFKQNGYNGYVSDLLPFNRSLPDIRHIKCRQFKYSANLPTVAVIFPFHDEHFTTLLRTAWSVYLRSPRAVLREIILVDDASTKPALKAPLDSYLARNLPIARVVRAGKRVGLIRARTLGAQHATKSDILVFLDSHSEANVNWLPPLIDPIARDYRTVTCPFVDVIDHTTYEYRAQDEGARGSFDWGFFYKRLPLFEEDKRRMPAPFKSPVMAGGYFAISRRWFFELGAYDPEIDIWGGEQYELSFKLWQCGGQMFDVPCSRVGHIYRKFAPFPNARPGVDFVGKNYRRVAEVWMDEYAQYMYKRREHVRTADAGDLTSVRAVRERLKCKPFKWFIENVMPDQDHYYPAVPPPHIAVGHLRLNNTDWCVDTMNRGENDDFRLAKCKDASESNMVYSWRKDIHPRKRNLCFDVAASESFLPVRLFNCHGYGGNQEWKYDNITGHISHRTSRNCIEANPAQKQVYMMPCSNIDNTNNNLRQVWRFDTFNSTAYENTKFEW